MKYEQHSPAEFYARIQNNGYAFRVDGNAASYESATDNLSILDITGNRKDPEYMLYYRGKKFALTDEDHIMDFIEAVCEKSTSKIVHELKIQPEYFEAVLTDKKLFEYRKNDRNFMVKDVLFLREFIPDFNVYGGPLDGYYTGREMKVIITYMLVLSDDNAIIDSGNDYVILGIKKI